MVEGVGKEGCRCGTWQIEGCKPVSWALVHRSIHATDRAGDMISILVDGRRVAADQASFIEGLVATMREMDADWHLSMALDKSCALPASLESRVSSFYLPHAAELFWPRLGRGFDLLISPDARLPLLPMPCPMVHAVHDVLPRCGMGRLRLRRALATARLSWFDAERTQRACEALVGHALAHASVRAPDDWDGHLRDLEAIVGDR